jgi:hypothetical protein
LFAVEPECGAADPGDRPHGVFRSVAPGERVIVTGMVEHDGGRLGPASYRTLPARFRLAAPIGGALAVVYTGRPQVQSSAVSFSLARALAMGAGGALLIGSFVAGTEPECSDTGQLCLLYGTCGLTLDPSAGLSCVARDDEDCAASIHCRILGRCSREAGSCVARGDDCREASACQRWGLCSAAADGTCVAVDDADCTYSEACSQRGECRALAGSCLSQDQIDQQGRVSEAGAVDIVPCETRLADSGDHGARRGVDTN